MKNNDQITVYSVQIRRIIINSSYFRLLVKGNYKIIGVVFLLAGAAYAARAFLLIRAPGELPMTNTYPIVIGTLLCMSALGVYICGAVDEKAFCCRKTELFVALTCFIIFTLTFEIVGTVKASFIFSFILGSIWNRNIPASEETAPNGFINKYLAANKFNIAENILASCVSAAGIWLVFERIFSLSLP